MALDLKSIPKEFVATADFLRSGDAKLTLKQGTLDGRRVDFFKGKHAVNALLRKPSPKRPTVTSRPTAESHLSELHRNGLFIQVDRSSKPTKPTTPGGGPPPIPLQLSQPQAPFSPDNYYAWVYEGSQLKGILIGTGVLAVTFAGVMFPLWPASLRQGVYYLSLGLLGLMGLFMVLVLFRMVLWLVLKAGTGRDGWLYPNLFADVGVVESFTPVWGWEDVKPKKKRSKAVKEAVGSDGDGDGNIDHED
ncbi:translocation protein Sec62-domain-containing protein [Fimicolochytrium jonesii]|uniref:translocation protein Sec62-domain-containing protein n=1 Tax=Fimicolochytrium jonesii TaxID=1396493 RepID=UPI0022FE1A17|nr:translocation protein Sec62-domain-containing protein [Fimicolochytrium jonesii]KAI8826008.1 translocation protein Sec62-domain-containing protein [Fimicolochytrium jonesii]